MKRAICLFSVVFGAMLAACSAGEGLPATAATAAATAMAAAPSVAATNTFIPLIEDQPTPTATTRPPTATPTATVTPSPTPLSPVAAVALEPVLAGGLQHPTAITHALGFTHWNNAAEITPSGAPDFALKSTVGAVAMRYARYSM